MRIIKSKSGNLDKRVIKCIAGEILNLEYNREIFKDGVICDTLPDEHYPQINVNNVSYDIISKNGHIYISKNCVVDIKALLKDITTYCHSLDQLCMDSFSVLKKMRYAQYTPSVYTSIRKEYLINNKKDKRKLLNENVSNKQSQLKYNWEVKMLETFDFKIIAKDINTIVDKYFSSILVDIDDILVHDNNHMQHTFGIIDFRQSKLIKNDYKSIDLSLHYNIASHTLRNVKDLPNNKFYKRSDTFYKLQHRYIFRISIDEVLLKPKKCKNGQYRDDVCWNCNTLLHGDNYVLSYPNRDILYNYSFAICPCCIHTDVNSIVDKFGVIFVVEFPNTIQNIITHNGKLTNDEKALYLNLIENNINADYIKKIIDSQGYFKIDKYVLFSGPVLELMCNKESLNFDESISIFKIKFQK